MTETQYSFHPEFSSPKSAAIILAEDETAFRFPLDVLAQYSSFFETLAHLPTPSSPAEDGPSTTPANPPIPLHFTPSSALHYVLVATRAHAADAPPPPLPPLDVVTAVIEVADAFDMPFLYTSLYTDAKYGDANIFVLFTLAALAGDPEVIASYARLLRGYTEADIDPWAAARLKHKLPGAYLSLTRFLERWYSDRIKFVEYFRDTALEVRERTDEEAEECPTTCVLAQHFKNDLGPFSEKFAQSFIDWAGVDLPDKRTMDVMQFCRARYNCETCAGVLGELLAYIWKRFERGTFWDLSIGKSGPYSG